MAAWKRSGRAAASPRRLPQLPRIPWLGLGWIAAAVYGFLFLRLPIAEGIELEGMAISRAAFVMSSLLYPEGVVELWFDQGRLPAGFLDRLPIAAGTLLWLALAAALGLPVVDRVSPRPQTARARSLGTAAAGRLAGWAAELERFAIATLTGLALLSTLTLLVGLAGGLHGRMPLAIAILALAAVVYGLAGWRRSPAAVHTDATADAVVPAWSDDTPSRGLFDRACVVVSIALVGWLGVATMLGAWVPASEFDVLEYHLQAPKEFFELGSIRFLPHNVYANMPLGTEMHTLAMLTLIAQPDAWLGGLVGKSITASLSLVGAALLGGYLARRYGALCGWWGAGLWLGTPGIAHVAMLGLVDGALATYVLAAALCVARVGEALRSGQLERSCALGWWGMASLMAGAAAAAKYPGLIFAVVPVGVAFALFVWRGWTPGQSWFQASEMALPRRDRLRACAWVVLALMVTCVPWYAKNWVQAGNPVYPLAAGAFGGKTLTPAKIEQWQRAHRVPPSAAPEAGPVARVIGGLRLAVKDVFRLVLTSPYVQPAMVCGLCVGVGVWLSRRCVPGSSFGLWLGWSLWMVGVWWLATHRIDRFWLPVTGLWAALSAVGLCWLRSRGTPWLAHAIAIMGLVYAGLFNSSSLISDNRYFVSLAALRNDVTSDEQIGRVPAEQAWINEHVAAAGSRVLLIGEARVFEYPAGTLYSTCFDVNPGEAMLRGQSPAEQATALHEHGITHIMIHWRELARYRSPGNYGFSDWPQRADIEHMIASGVLSRVDWPIRDGSAELFQVEPLATSN